MEALVILIRDSNIAHKRIIEETSSFSYYIELEMTYLFASM